MSPPTHTHKTITNYPKMYMEPQKILNCQTNLENKRTKLEVPYYLDFSLSYKAPTKQHCTDTKTDTLINGIE